MFPESVIVVVGGESDESETIASALSDQYRVVGVEKPEEAMSYLADGVDLVISQLDSPDFSGLQLLRTWKARDRRTPFLFVTEGSDVSSVIEAMKLGANDCLLRPVNANHLRTTVARLLERAPEKSAGSQESRGVEEGGGKVDIDIPPGTSLEDLERAAVEQALAQHQGNRTHAAKTLGISVRTLQRKLKAWGMPLNAQQQGSSTRQSAPSHNFVYSEGEVSPVTHAPFSAHAH